MVSSRNSSSSNASDTVTTAPSSVPVATAPVPRMSVPPSSSGDTCGCRTNASPRSCYECLNVKLQSGNSCVVTPLGLCMSSSAVSSMQSFFSSTLAFCSTSQNCGVVGHSNQYFCSFNATYCETTDVKCASCRANWIDGFEADLLRDNANFSCTGSGGCICTAYCELRDASNITLLAAYDTGGEYCSAVGTGSKANGASMNTIMNSIALVAAAILIAFLLRSGITHFRQREHQLDMAARRRAVRIERIVARRSRPTLNLEGWNAYREQLIGHEQQNLGLKTESIFSEAPSRVIVEEGFRSASPS